MYEILFMAGLKKLTTRTRHARVLRHSLLCLRPHLDQQSRDAIATSVQEYRRGRVPLAVAVSSIGHYVRLFNIRELRDQVYLKPDPRELMRPRRM